MKHISLILLLFVFISCEKAERSTVSGFVFNRFSNEPIQEVDVAITDAANATFLGDFPWESNTEQVIKGVTDANGYFSLAMESKSQILHFAISKENYGLSILSSGTTELVQGNHALFAQMVYFAPFNAVFRKTSGLRQNSDTLYIQLLSYEDINEPFRDKTPRKKYGIGYFSYFSSLSSTTCYGDAYLRYKLEHKSEGAWHTVIDSVYLPFSEEIYTDTIYY